MKAYVWLLSLNIKSGGDIVLTFFRPSVLSAVRFRFRDISSGNYLPDFISLSEICLLISSIVHVEWASFPCYFSTTTDWISVKLCGNIQYGPGIRTSFICQDRFIHLILELWLLNMANYCIMCPNFAILALFLLSYLMECLYTLYF